jgi:shikimate 5-dehydrogenase
VMNRTSERAAALVSACPPGCGAVAVPYVSAAKGGAAEEEAALQLPPGYPGVELVAVVVTVPPGVGWRPPTPLLAATRPVVFDVCYRPRLTPALTAAEAAGCLSVPGVDMLAAQAWAANALWTARPTAIVGRGRGIALPPGGHAAVAAAGYRAIGGGGAK